MFASRSPRRRLSVVLGTAALGIALGSGLTGCGDETSDSAADPATDPASTSAAPSDPASDPAASGPACADTWVADADLPSPYRGCVDDTGAFVKAEGLGCSSGQRIIRYDDRFYAVPGGTIHEAAVSLSKDRDYRAAVLRCRA